MTTQQLNHSTREVRHKAILILSQLGGPAEYHLVEQYFLKINIEAETTEYLARTYILPAAIKYLREVADTAEAGGDIDESD